MSNLKKQSKRTLSTESQDKAINYIEKYSVLNSLRLFKKVKSPLVAFKSDSPSLAQMGADSNTDTVLAYIQIWLLNLNDYLNISRKLTPTQILEIAYYIYSDYYYFKITDIYLIFTNIKKGYYGQFYESLDGVKLISYFEKYANERANAVEGQSIEESKSFKNYDADRVEGSKHIRELLNIRK